MCLLLCAVVMCYLYDSICRSVANRLEFERRKWRLFWSCLRLGSAMISAADILSCTAWAITILKTELGLFSRSSPSRVCLAWVSSWYNETLIHMALCVSEPCLCTTRETSVTTADGKHTSHLDTSATYSESVDTPLYRNPYPMLTHIHDKHPTE